jgi:rubrerythrin
MTLIPTHDTGARTMPLSMTVCEPARAVTPEALEEQVLPGSGLNVPFIAGALSAFLAHERAGATLYRVAATHTENPELVDKYEEFGRETEEHIAIYEQLIADLGGDPQYVSPAARMAEQFGTKLLEGPVSLAGSVDLVTLETAFLEAVVLAEHRCHDNWQLLARMAESLPDEARRHVEAAVAQVEPQEDEHIRWAAETWVTLAMTNAEHPAAEGLMGLVERTAQKVKDTLS